MFKTRKLIRFRQTVSLMGGGGKIPRTVSLIRVFHKILNKRYPSTNIKSFRIRQGNRYHAFQRRGDRGCPIRSTEHFLESYFGTQKRLIAAAAT